MRFRLRSPLVKFALCSLFPLLWGCTKGKREVGAADPPDPQPEITTLDLAREEGEACGQMALHSTSDASDADRATRAFTQCLSSYIRIPTVNPPGNEELAATFLDASFRAAGFLGRIVRVKTPDATAPRTAFVLTLLPQSPGTDGALILLHHSDVVQALPDQWEHPALAFGGQVAASRDGPADEVYIWGRGALDMKSTGILQMFALLRAARDPDRKRAIHYVAVPDEEQNSIGTRGILASMVQGGELAELAGASLALNEGGLVLEGGLGGGRDLALIGTEDKGGAWLAIENPTLPKLIRALALLDPEGVSAGDHAGAKTIAGCNILSADTTQAKANVVASRVEVDVSCPASVAESDKRFVDAVKTAGRGILTATVDGVSGSAAGPTKFHAVLSSATSGHGSLAVNASPLAALAALFTPEESRPAEKSLEFLEPIATPSTKAMIDAFGAKHVFPLVPGVEKLSEKLAVSRALERFALRKLGGAFATERLFRTTCAWSALAVDDKRARALLDCRLVTPREVSKFLDEVRLAIQDPATKIEPLNVWNFTSSSFDTPEFNTLAKAHGIASSDVVATPYMFPMSSDNVWLRDPASAGVTSVAPMTAYGFLPVPLAMSLISTIHGSDERFPLRYAASAASAYSRAVSNLVR